MMESERNWRSTQNIEHQNLFTKSLSSIEDIQSTPLIYGKKNNAYVSPTFKSSALFYGSNKIREAPKEAFSTINEIVTGTTLSLSPTRLEQFSQKCASTNKFNAFQNNFHKSPTNLNLKNFSQVQLGYNSNVEECYIKQFQTRKNIAELKYGKPHINTGTVYDNVQQNKLSPTIQPINENERREQQYQQSIERQIWTNQQLQILKRQVSQTERTQSNFSDHKYNNKVNRQEYNIHREIDNAAGNTISIQQQHQIDQNKYQSNESNKIQPILKDRPFSPQPKKSVTLLSPRQQTTRDSQIEAQNQKQPTSRQLQIQQYQSYDAPDWGFFSPQNDPCKYGFDVRSRQRTLSCEKLQNERYFLFDPMEIKKRKLALQNQKIGDQFVQQMNGDTLRLNYDKKEELIQQRRQKIQACFQANQIEIEQTKRALQNNEFGEGGLYKFLGERDENQIRSDKIKNRDYLKSQIYDTMNNQRINKIHNLELENQIVEAAKEQNRVCQHSTIVKQCQTKSDLMHAYEKDQDYKAYQKYQQQQEKLQQKQFIDSAFSRANYKQGIQQAMKKEIQHNLAASYKDAMYQKRGAAAGARNYQPLAQQSLQFFQNTNFYNNNPHGFNNTLVGGANLTKITLQDLDKSQHSQFNQSQRNNALSNCSTLSSYSQQQLTKANISSNEYQIRKKQIENMKQGSFKNSIVGKEKQSQKFSMKSRQIEGGCISPRK